MGTTGLLDVGETVAIEILSSSQAKPNIVIRLIRVGLALITIQRGDAETAKEQYSFAGYSSPAIHLL